MAAPSFIQEAETAFNTVTTPKTSASITDLIADILVSCGVAEDGQITSVTPTLTGETFIAQENIGTSAANCRIDARTAVIASAGTGETVSVARSALSGWFGANALLFRGSDGVGAAESAQITSGSSGPSLSITTTQDNSAIVVIVTDWLAGVNPTGWTWRTVNGSAPTVQTTFFDSSHYAFAVAYYPDAGTAGAKSVGITNSIRYTVAAIEVKGSAGAGSQTINPGFISSGEQVFAPTLAPGSVTVTPAAVASVSQLFAPSFAFGSITITPGTISAGSQVFAPTLAPTFTLTPGTIASGETVFAPSLAPGSVTLTPGVVASTEQVFAPSVGSFIVVTPGVIASGETVFSPTFAPGSVSISPGFIAAGSQVFQASLAGGAVGTAGPSQRPTLGVG